MDRLEQVRRAYERGRMRGAVAFGLPGVAFGLAAWLLNGLWAIVVGGSLLLAVLSVVFVYRGGAVGRAVPAGLLAGVMPFVLPLVAHGQACAMGGDCTSWCMAACSLGGASAGFWLGWRSHREPGGGAWLIAGVGLATLTGSLGCVCIGVPGVAAMVTSAVFLAWPARVARGLITA